MKIDIPEEALLPFKSDIIRMRKIKNQIEKTESLSQEEIKKLNDEYNQLGFKIQRAFLNAILESKVFESSAD